MTIEKLKKNINTILNILQLSSLSLPFIYAINALKNTYTDIIRNILAVLLFIITGLAFWYAITLHDAFRKKKLSNSYEDSVKILFENKFDKICEKLFLNFVSLITICLFMIPEDIRTNNTKYIIFYLILTFLFGAPVYLAIDRYKEKGNSILSYLLFSYALISNIVIPIVTFFLGGSLLLEPILGLDTKSILILYPISLFLVIIALISCYFWEKNKSKR